MFSVIDELRNDKTIQAVAAKGQEASIVTDYVLKVMSLVQRLKIKDKKIRIPSSFPMIH